MSLLLTTVLTTGKLSILRLGRLLSIIRLASLVLFLGAGALDGIFYVDAGLADGAKCVRLEAYGYG